jgi:hypothetical protein
VNTLSDQLLENVKVDLVLPEGFILRAVIPCPKLPYGERESTYAILEYPAGDVAGSAGKFIDLWFQFYLFFLNFESFPSNFWCHTEIFS